MSSAGLESESQAEPTNTSHSMANRARPEITVCDKALHNRLKSRFSGTRPSGRLVGLSDKFVLATLTRSIGAPRVVSTVSTKAVIASHYRPL